ncbi:MAG: hypothetical protein ACRDOK_14860 [Streptosporangiaceae bacterium]
MIEVPEPVLAAVAGLPVVGELDQAFLLLTAHTSGPVDVCLLSRTELRATSHRVLLVTTSSKARRNLADNGRATLVAVTADSAHYLALQLRRSVSDDNALACEFTVARTLRDAMGVELRCLQFRVAETLRLQERWQRTADLLDRLESAADEVESG